MDTDHLFGESSRAAAAEQVELERELKRRRIARTLVLPPSDSLVRVELRKLVVPVTLFGEDAHDRRERLRFLWAERAESNPEFASQVPVQNENVPAEPRKQQTDAVFYTEGSAQLKSLRLELAHPTLSAARTRLQQQKEDLTRFQAGGALAERTRVLNSIQLIERCARMQLISSQTAHSRPLSHCCMLLHEESKNLVATASFGGHIGIWNIQNGKRLHEIESMSPHRVVSLSSHNKICFLLASAADGTCQLWYADEHQLSQVFSFRGNGNMQVILNDSEMHPIQNGIVATAAVDGVWRLYDVRRQLSATQNPENSEGVSNSVAEPLEAVLEQSGHGASVSVCRWHPDGALLASGGSDGSIFLWDIRSGKYMARWDGVHKGGVCAARFDPRGVELATGGKDNQIRIWDLRKSTCLKTIAAHNGPVTNLRYQEQNKTSVYSGHDQILLSSSLDRTCKLWACRRGYGLINTLGPHPDKVMDADLSSDGTTVVSASFDKCVRLWTAPDSLPPLSDTE